MGVERCLQRRRFRRFGNGVGALATIGATNDPVRSFDWYSGQNRRCRAAIPTFGRWRHGHNRRASIGNKRFILPKLARQPSDAIRRDDSRRAADGSRDRRIASSNGRTAPGPQVQVQTGFLAPERASAMATLPAIPGQATPLPDLEPGNRARSGTARVTGLSKNPPSQNRSDRQDMPPSSLAHSLLPISRTE